MKKQSALRLVDTRTLDRVQWLEVRKGGIGSSDAAAAVGLNPYKSQLELWMEKTGRTAANEESPGMQDPRFWGTLLEPYVAVAYMQKTDRKVRKINAVLQHPTFNFMLANIDREVVGCPEVQILECKTAGEFGSRLWREGVPEYIQLQVQHQLAVTGKAAADVAVLLCGQELEIHRIPRDDEVIARLIVLETRFWEYVETDTPPPADGSESAARALRQFYPGNSTTLDFSQDEPLSQVFASLTVLKAELEIKEKQAEEHKQTLQQAMGDASRAVFVGGEVTFKRSKDGTSLDSKRLAAEHPSLAAQYAVTRPGSRRFVLSLASDQPKEELNMLKGLAITPPVIGRISIGRVVERNGKRLPEKDDQFTLTSQVQNREGWVLHPLDEKLRKEAEGNKLRSIPVRLLFNDPTLNLRADYSLFDRSTGRPVCVGNGEACRRTGNEGMASLPCVGPDACAFAKGDCKAYARLNVVIGDGEEDALGSFVLRTTSYNTIRTLEARLQYFNAVSGGRLSCMPLELKLRGKSTTMSFRQAIYYVDLVVRSGLTLEQAIAEARQKDEQRRESGFDQEALDEAARKGFANGAFEDLAEDVSAVVEEFYPEAEPEESGGNNVRMGPGGLRDRLEEKVARVGSG